MLPETLLAVLASGGSVLVNAVATDAWQAARGGLVQLFGRAGPRRAETATRWADEMASELDRPELADRTEAEQRWARTWHQRLSDLAEEYPEVGAEIQAWAQSVRAELPADKQVRADMFISRDHSQQYNAPGGSITVHQHSRDGTSPE